MRKTKAAAEHSKQQILMAAADIFLSKGYASATVEEIGHSVGMSKGAVFWHFQSKAGVLKALAETVLDHLENEMRKTLDMPVTIMSKFRNLLFFVQNDRLLPVLSLFGRTTPLDGIPVELHAQINSRLNRLMSAAIDTTEAAKKRGELRADTNVADIMALIIAVVYGFTTPESLPGVINKSIKGANREGVINILFEGLLSFQQ